MKKGVILRGLLLFFLVLAVSLTPRYDQVVSRVMNSSSSEVIVIDPGHGGIDGGAVSGQGVSEKAINLAIAKELQKMAEDAGWQVVMTRESDVSLGEGQPTIRSKKVRDLHARQELIEKVQPALVVSIHLNSFQEDRSVHGIQAFYPGGGGDDKDLQQSKKLANEIQKAVTSSLQDGTKRTPLAKDNVFLFKKVVCPVTIVECGFLSNNEEASKLQNTRYQQKLAKNIFYGISNFTGKKPKKITKIIENSDN